MDCDENRDCCPNKCTVHYPIKMYVCKLNIYIYSCTCMHMYICLHAYKYIYRIMTMCRHVYAVLSSKCLNVFFYINRDLKDCCLNVYI